MVTPTNIEAIRAAAGPPSGQPSGKTEPLSRESVVTDRVDFSEQGQIIAELAALIEDLQTNELRRERVEEAKQQIREGTYKLTEVVTQVAGRIAGSVIA